VLTSAPVATLAGRAATLAGTATRREETLPLSARREELPEIAARMMEQLEPDAHVRLLPQTVVALRARAWPGNLHELWAVLEHALQRRWGDAIGVKDLPDGYRAEVPDHAIAPLDRAQRDVIVATLRRYDGNKVKVAAALGLSRTTLYARMRALQITTY
jgi:transcriptional regulator of acetoin/glycerol metabolism